MLMTKFDEDKFATWFKPKLFVYFNSYTSYLGSF